MTTLRRDRAFDSQRNDVSCVSRFVPVSRGGA